MKISEIRALLTWVFEGSIEKKKVPLSLAVKHYVVAKYSCTPVSPGQERVLLVVKGPSVQHRLTIIEDQFVRGRSKA